MEKTEPQPMTVPELSEVEKMKQARIKRLRKELNANSMQRAAIEEELRELGCEVKRRV